MRNGIPFNKLTLIGSRSDAGDDMAASYPYQPSGDDVILADDNHHAKTTLLVFMAVSLACATAAIATGGYAAWLVRQRSARQALTDVNDILKSCQSRMRQLEADVQRLPSRQV